MTNISEETLWKHLENIMDPEIPVVNLVEMGIIRHVNILSDQEVQVTMTPTFSGCPAQTKMKEDIIQMLSKLGFNQIQIEITLSPPWSTDWIHPEARNKLKTFGLAPPRIHSGFISTILLESTACPYCDSENTSLKNPWGATPCRMIYFCNQCNQPFEQFKPL